MIKRYLLIAAALLSIFSCENTDKANHPNNAQLSASDVRESAKAPEFVNQLFMFQESTSPNGCGPDGMPAEENVLTGALCLTDKGRVIITRPACNGCDDSGFYVGDYTMNDTTLTCQITEEFDFTGSWLNHGMDYSDGHMVKFKIDPFVLRKGQCDSLVYYRLYSAEEKENARLHYKDKGIVPAGLHFWEYKEPPGQKYFTYIFKQIPAFKGMWK